jgi:exodeoxyribonuclease VII small subunit
MEEIFIEQGSFQKITVVAIVLKIAPRRRLPLAFAALRLRAKRCGGTLLIDLTSQLAPSQIESATMSPNKESPAMAKSARDKSNPERNEDEPFEVMLQQLEDTVRKLEQGNLGLQDSLEAYQLGIDRLKRCHKILAEAELKIEMLSGVDEDGKPVTRAVDASEMTLEEKQASRSRRRSASDD